MLALRRIKREDQPRLKRFWRQHWMGEEIIVHAEILQPGQVEGFVSEDWTGLVTYLIEENSCEIISLDSLKQGRGTGTPPRDEIELKQLLPAKRNVGPGA